MNNKFIRFLQGTKHIDATSIPSTVTTHILIYILNSLIVYFEIIPNKIKTDSEIVQIFYFSIPNIDILTSKTFFCLKGQRKCSNMHDEK